MGNPLSAQDYNGYSYCANNPLKYTDPSGYTYLSVMLERGGVFAYRGSYINGGEGNSGGGGGSSSYGLPCCGDNGSGAGGYYYDYTSGTYRSTSSLGVVSFDEVKINYVSRYGKDWTTGGIQYLRNQQYRRNSGSFALSIMANLGSQLIGAYTGIPNMSRGGQLVGFYHWAPVFESSTFNNGGGGITIPPLGIWVGEGVFKSTESINQTLMAHEYGHWLQFWTTSPEYFYEIIAPASFFFAITGNKAGWCEVNASIRGFQSLDKPIKWDYNNFPLHK